MRFYVSVRGRCLSPTPRPLAICFPSCLSSFLKPTHGVCAGSSRAQESDKPLVPRRIPG